MGANQIDGIERNQTDEVEVASPGYEDKLPKPTAKPVANELKIRLKLPKFEKKDVEAVIADKVDIEDSIPLVLLSENKEICKESGNHIKEELVGANCAASEDSEPRKRKRSGGKHAGENTETFPCEECRKTFASLKSLYGHLRSHPNRVRRKIAGTRSPSQNPEPLRKWSITSKRGRKVTTEDPTPDVMYWAQTLFLMSRGLRSPNGSEGTHINSRIVMDYDDYTTSLLSDSMQYNVTMEYRDKLEDQEMYIDKETKSLLIESNETVELKDWGIAKEPSSLSNHRRYVCDICDKSFPSHQSLGGHKAGHNKSKNNLDGRKDLKEIYGGHQSSAGDLIDPSSSETDVAAAIHKCNICKMGFRSGQALGGHKRCHWTPENRNVPSASPQPSTSLPTTSGSSKEANNGPVFNFDLNETPKAEDESF